MDNRNINGKEELLGDAAQALGTSPEKLASQLKGTPAEQYLKNMKPAEAQKLGALLRDKEATARLLSTPQAQQLMKQLFNSSKTK